MIENETNMEERRENGDSDRMMRKVRGRAAIDRIS